MARKSKKSKAAVAVPMANPKLGSKGVGPSRALARMAAVPPAAKSNGKTAAEEPAPRQARINIDVAEGTPAFYANYIEIGHTKWDFTLIASRVPAKPSTAKIVEMQSNGIFTIPADATINFPPNLMPGLIRALTIQKEAFEKATGIELKDKANERDAQTGNVQAKRRKRGRG